MSYYAERHLILVNRPGWQAAGDFQMIKQRVNAIAPEIEVFIATSNVKDNALAETASKRPTLCVSFSPLNQFIPLRGRIYAGRAISKLRQLKRLAAHGIAVPATVLLKEGVKLDPNIFGPFVLLKPSTIAGASKGNGISLVPTHLATHRPPESYPEGHPARMAPLLAQQFIDSGEGVSVYRVNTLLGAIIYCLHIELEIRRPSLASIIEETSHIKIATNAKDSGKRILTLAKPDDVLALASRCQLAEPTTPLKGIDIIRDIGTGRLYVLELNTVSDTWHISSNFSIRLNVLPRRGMIEQFGAFNVAARVLADRCRAEAL